MSVMVEAIVFTLLVAIGGAWLMSRAKRCRHPMAHRVALIEFGRHVGTKCTACDRSWMWDRVRP